MFPTELDSRAIDNRIGIPQPILPLDSSGNSNGRYACIPPANGFR